MKLTGYELSHDCKNMLSIRSGIDGTNVTLTFQTESAQGRFFISQDAGATFAEYEAPFLHGDNSPILSVQMGNTCYCYYYDVSSGDYLTRLAIIDINGGYATFPVTVDGSGGDYYVYSLMRNGNDFIAVINDATSVTTFTAFGAISSTAFAKVETFASPLNAYTQPVLIDGWYVSVMSDGPNFMRARSLDGLHYLFQVISPDVPYFDFALGDTTAISSTEDGGSFATRYGDSGAFFDFFEPVTMGSESHPFRNLGKAYSLITYNVDQPVEVILSAGTGGVPQSLELINIDPVEFGATRMRVIRSANQAAFILNDPPKYVSIGGAPPPAPIRNIYNKVLTQTVNFGRFLSMR